MDLQEVTQYIVASAVGFERYIVAVAGPPGAGKSTFSAKLVDGLQSCGIAARIIPMDGFHLDNTLLEKQGLLQRKGAPETFDVTGFTHLLQRLKSVEKNVAIPIFDRNRDASIAGADIVSSQDQILVVEGNYLLLDGTPWSALQCFWNETIFINPGLKTLKQRLIQRWLDQGLDPDAAKKRAFGNDIPNARYVLDRSKSANFQIQS